jgi:carbamoyltransferase
MSNWGINALNHDASIAIVGDKLDFWTKASDVSGIKRDDKLNPSLIEQATKIALPKRIFWYERPWIKKSRQLYAGQYATAFDMSTLPSRHLKEMGLGQYPVTYVPHHASHAAAGYFTSPFKSAAIVVMDAIGEWECASIWHAQDNNITKVWSRSYPHSLGLFYSAFTKLIGFVPIEQEYLLQSSAEQGNHLRYYNTVKHYFSGLSDPSAAIRLRYNLHRGVQNWPHPIQTLQDRCDIAAAVQKVFEEQVLEVMGLARHLTACENLVYMGGCAMNSRANRLFETDWKRIWSLPNPGDPSSSIGAVLWGTRQRIGWDGPIAKHIAIKL